MKHAPRRHRTKPASGPSLLERINPNAAGIDCGSTEHYVAVPGDRDAAPCARSRPSRRSSTASPTGSRPAASPPSR